MSVTIKTIIKHCVTQQDGESYDLTRIISLVGIIFYLGLATHNVVKTGNFDYVAFATGFATITAACGGAIGIRAKLEDKN